MGKHRASSDLDFGIRVGAVIERDGTLLLARHQKPNRPPYWILPGGRLEPGESIPECAVREVAEETGLAGEFTGILYVSEFQREGRHTVDVTVRVTAEGEAKLGHDPEVEPGSEPTLSELRWVTTEDLRGIQLLPTGLKARLVRDASDGWRAGEAYLGGADA